MPAKDDFLTEIYSHGLANQMRVVGMEYSRVPWVSLTFMAKRGSEADPAGKGGAADCLAECLTLGTQKRDQLELALATEGRGAMLRAHGTWDHTLISLEGLAEDFPDLLALLAEIVQDPGFPQEEFAFLQERRQAELIHLLDDPREVANRTFLPLLFGDAPYGHPPDGSPASLAALSLEDLQVFYQQQFSPPTSSLVVVGMVPEAQVVAAAEQLWGAWPGSAQPTPSLQQTAEVAARPGIYLLDRPNLTQSEIRCGHLGVPRNNPDYFPLRLVNYILGGGGFSSRLMMRIRAEKGLTYGIRSQFHFRRAPGPFIISTFTPAEHTATVLQEIKAVMAAVKGEGVAPAELADAQSYYVGSFPLSLETPGGLARQLTSIELHDLGNDYLKLYRPRVLAVDQEVAQDAAQRHLHPEDLVMLVVGPAAKCADELEKIGPVQVLQDI
ncbi:MAG: insulinase family protein [Deltaproteobacteria bacterium]|nr:insulinase family protein [Deltaproteobacteria bacterium]